MNKDKIVPSHLLALLSLVLLSKLTLDLYLPILMTLKEVMQADDIALKSSLSLYMVGFSFSLLVSSPLADRFGAKNVMLLSAINYTIAALICAFAQDINTIIIARIMQSFSGGAGTVLGRLDVRYNYNHRCQIKALGYISAITAISPVLLPLLANYLNDHYGWRVVFIAMAACSLLCSVLVFLYIEQQPMARQKVVIRALFKLYIRLLLDKVFLSIMLTTIITWCSYFVYLAASPFIFQEYLRVSALHYVFILAFVSTGYTCGSLFLSGVASRFNIRSMLRNANYGMFFVSTLLIIYVIFCDIDALGITSLLGGVMIFVGIILPCCQALILQRYQEESGHALALYFFLQFLFGAIASIAVRNFSNFNLLCMVSAIIAIGSVLRLFLYNTATSE